MISIHSQFSDMKYNLPIFHRFSQKCQIIVLAPFFQLNGGPNQRLNIPGKWNININNGFISIMEIDRRLIQLSTDLIL